MRSIVAYAEPYIIIKKLMHNKGVSFQKILKYA